MLKQYLYKEILNHISEIAEDDVYAISILVECNNYYKGFENFPSIVMLYNTERIVIMLLNVVRKDGILLNGTIVRSFF